MRFGRAATLEEFDGECVARFADEAGLGAPYIRRRVSDLADAVTEEIEKGVLVPGNPPEDAVAPIAEALSTRTSAAALSLLEV